MLFTLELNPDAKLTTIPVHGIDNHGDDSQKGIPLFYSEEYENVNSILLYITEEMYEEEAFSFKLSACGDNAWPVAHSWELCIFLEHLPGALAAMRNQSNFNIDFYEQGVERKIEFTLHGDTYEARTFSWGVDERGHEFVPEKVDRTELYNMLLRIQTDFIDYLTAKAPEIAAHPWIREFFRMDENPPQQLPDSV